MKKIVYKIEDDSYLAFKTLDECKECEFGEDDLYYVKGDFLFYGNSIIGKDRENK